MLILALPGDKLHYLVVKSVEAYEHNLQVRLAELRRGDPAYEAHGDAILETLPYSSLNAPEHSIERILDVGCGLGFLSLKLARWPDTEVTGIDPSQKAIELAKTEHQSEPNLDFLSVSAEAFPAIMEQEGIEPFDRAILNMVMHSINDATCTEVLAGIRQALAPHGILTCIVPGRDWLLQKLVEKAQSEGMNKEDGVAWIVQQMSREVVDIAVSIKGQPAYPKPIHIWNRSLEDYARLFLEDGFGVNLKTANPETRKAAKTVRLPYWEWSDHLNGHTLAQRDRHILMTQR